MPSVCPDCARNESKTCSARRRGFRGPDPCGGRGGGGGSGPRKQRGIATRRASGVRGTRDPGPARHTSASTGPGGPPTGSDPRGGRSQSGRGGGPRPFRTSHGASTAPIRRGISPPEDFARFFSAPGEGPRSEGRPELDTKRADRCARPTKERGCTTGGGCTWGTGGLGPLDGGPATQVDGISRGASRGDEG